MELRSVVQKIALSRPSYGYRRVASRAETACHQVNHKRVRRLMREDNLLCLRRRSFVRTTDSRHGFTVYPNLAKEMVLTDINQLWVAILPTFDCHPSSSIWRLILDAYSRRVVAGSWAAPWLAELALGALASGAERSQLYAGLVHHSDRGCSMLPATTRNYSAITRFGSA